MTDRIYIRPIALVPGPQSEHGDAIRLAGTSVHRFHDTGPTASKHGETGAAQPRS